MFQECSFVSFLGIDDIQNPRLYREVCLCYDSTVFGIETLFLTLGPYFSSIMQFLYTVFVVCHRVCEFERSIYKKKEFKIYKRNEK